MNIEDAVKHLHIPHELNEFIGDYYKALVKRADIDLLGESEFRCFARFLEMYASSRYQFAGKAMRRLFQFLHMLIYIDEDESPGI